MKDSFRQVPWNPGTAGVHPCVPWPGRPPDGVIRDLCQSLLSRPVAQALLHRFGAGSLQTQVGPNTTLAQDRRGPVKNHAGKEGTVASTDGAECGEGNSASS